MTAGNVVVLGDPGPWICSGMTGGTVYCHLDETMGMNRAALERRLAKGGQVVIRGLEEVDAVILGKLLREYERELLYSQQPEEAVWVEQVRTDCRTRFVKIVALSAPVQPPVSTE
jgi:glutamate synthase (NADPH/NADH) large chain